MDSIPDGCFDVIIDKGASLSIHRCPAFYFQVGRKWWDPKWWELHKNTVMTNGSPKPFAITVFLYGNSHHSHHFGSHHFRPTWISSVSPVNRSTGYSHSHNRLFRSNKTSHPLPLLLPPSLPPSPFPPFIFNSPFPRITFLPVALLSCPPLFVAEGLLDALLCSKNNIKDVATLVKEMYRVLAPGEPQGSVWMALSEV